MPEFWITRTPEHCAVSRHEAPRGVAEASYTPYLGPEAWYLNRLPVRSADERGKGLGARLLRTLQRVLREQRCRELYVDPGGYGSDPKRLAVFYQRHGFEPATERGEGSFVWRCK